MLTYSVLHAGKIHAPLSSISFSNADTLIIGDTVKANKSLPNDLKQGFSNLFETSTVTGLSGTRLNPMAISFVQSYMSKYGKGLRAMKSWAKPYFDMIDNVLTQHGLPKELKYLAVIESGLRYNAISWAGAVGPWAFMPAAGRQYGLIVTKQNDERLDYFKSTHAAARMLTALFQKYQDWLLVIAAYNCGPGNVDKAINKSKSRDFWKLQYYLPTESMNHVKKFISTHYVFEGEGGITTLTKDETKEQQLNNMQSISQEEMQTTTTYKIKGRFAKTVIIKYTNIDTLLFNRLNPGFDEAISLNGIYELRLPTQMMNVFVAKRYLILEESMQLLLNPGGNKD